MLRSVLAFVQVSVIFHDLVYVMKYDALVRIILHCFRITDVEQLSSVKYAFRIL